MTRTPSLGTSVVLLLVAFLMSAIFFGDLLPNHPIAIVLHLIIAALIYYVALLGYYHFTGDQQAE